MDSILQMVERVTVFLLGATVLTRLFGGMEYRKYMDFAVGLMVIAMVASPVLALFGNDMGIGDWLSRSVFDQKTKEAEEEIRLLGKSYEQSVWEQYEEQLGRDVAERCGVEPEKCRVRIRDGSIERIEVTVSGLQEPVVAKIKELSMCYGVDEECICLIEESER